MNIAIHVEGMTCGHCAETVEKAVSGIEGVSQVSVDLEGKEVRVDFDETRTQYEDIASQIQIAGFEVVVS